MLKNINVRAMIDIAEILKNAPEGLNLWSPIFGEVVFDSVEEEDDYEGGIGIRVLTPKTRYPHTVFNRYGQIEDNAPEICFLQPSSINTWGDPWQMSLMEPRLVVQYHKDPLAPSTNYAPVMILDKSRKDTLVEVKFKNGHIEWVEPRRLSFASIEDIEDYNNTHKEEEEEEEELPKLWSLKPFDKFLYRSKKGFWDIGLFGYKGVPVIGDPDYNIEYFTIGGFDSGDEVLPYNDETKHLHRTDGPRVGNWALNPAILE